MPARSSSTYNRIPTTSIRLRFNAGSVEDRRNQPVHLFGQGADLKELCEISSSHNVPLVEDAAQALGAVDDRGESLGTVGRVGCYSFFPSKNLGAFGDAGLVVTNDSDLYEQMKLMRVHGAAQAYMHEVVGGNFRIDAMQAAVLRVKLPHLESWSMRRRENAARYRDRFVEAGLSSPDGLYPTVDHPIALPVERYAGEEGLVHIYNQFVVRALNRDELSASLRAEGIGNAVYYPVPFHRQPCFEPWVDPQQSWPVADRAAAEVLAIPVFPELTDAQIDHLVDRVADFYSDAKVTDQAARGPEVGA